MMNKILRIIATGFYSGYSPIAPGTVGSALALGIYWLFPGFRGVPLFLSTGILFLIGVWAATEVEKTDGHDASIINIDEVVGMWVTLLFLPSKSWWLPMLIAFFLCRLFDIFKPFPVGHSQKLPRGWGVMVDDVLASLYAGFCLRFILWIFFR